MGRGSGRPVIARAARGAAAPEPGRRGRGWLALVGLLGAVGALAFVLSRGEEAPDPHYVRARDSVAAYELGKETDGRDYDHPVYQEALQELALVSPGSVSAAPAERLAGEIRQKIEAFHARMKTAPAPNIIDKKNVSTMTCELLRKYVMNAPPPIAWAVGPENAASTCDCSVKMPSSGRKI